MSDASPFEQLDPATDTVTFTFDGAAIAAVGPSVTRLGSSTSRSIRNSPERLITVNLFAVPPLSSPTTKEPETGVTTTRG